MSRCRTSDARRAVFKSPLMGKGAAHRNRKRPTRNDWRKEWA